MRFLPKFNQKTVQPNTEDVWLALQSHRSLEQQRQQLLDLETRLDHAVTLSRLGVAVLSVIVLASAVVTGWNTYQLQQWKSNNSVNQVLPQ